MSNFSPCANHAASLTVAADTLTGVSRFVQISSVSLGALALLWLDQALIGLILATASFALAIPRTPRASTGDVLRLTWSALVMMTFNFAHLELWRRLLIALVLRTEAASLPF